MNVFHNKFTEFVKDATLKAGRGAKKAGRGIGKGFSASRSFVNRLPSSDVADPSTAVLGAPAKAINVASTTGKILAPALIVADAARHAAIDEPFTWSGMVKNTVRDVFGAVHGFAELVYSNPIPTIVIITALSVVHSLRSYAKDVKDGTPWGIARGLLRNIGNGIKKGALLIIGADFFHNVGETVNFMTLKEGIRGTFNDIRNFGGLAEWVHSHPVGAIFVLILYSGIRSVEKYMQDAKESPASIPGRVLSNIWSGIRKGTLFIIAADFLHNIGTKATSGSLAQSFVKTLEDIKGFMADTAIWAWDHKLSTFLIVAGMIAVNRLVGFVSNKMKKAQASAREEAAEEEAEA